MRQRKAWDGVSKKLQKRALDAIKDIAEENSEDEELGQALRLALTCLRKHGKAETE